MRFQSVIPRSDIGFVRLIIIQLVNKIPEVGGAMSRIFLFSNRFSAKIILAFLLVILIPTLFTSVFFNFASDSILKKNVRESTVQIAKKTADSLSSILNVGSDTSDFIYSDLNIQHAVLHVNSSNSEEQSRMFQYMNTMLNNIVYSNSFVKIVYVLKDDGSGWGSGTFSDRKVKRMQLSSQSWVKEANSKNGEFVWQGIQYDLFSGGGVNTDLVLPVGRVLKDFNSLNNIGLIQVNLNGRAILNTIKELKLGETGKFFVVDAEGRVMIDPDLRLINKKVENPDLYGNIVNHDRAEFEFRIKGVPYYGVKQLLSNGWMIVGTVPVQEITGPLDKLQTWILLSSTVFALLAIGIGLFIASRVTRPINQLIRVMQLVQDGDLKVRTEVHSSDEIGLLSKQFNKMLHEIENLMQRVEDEQSQKHDAELRAVIHRVHPHFLYNTLSTLRLLIRSNQNDRAYQGLSALTRLLEANMAKSGNMVAVEEELDIIHKYLVILELRYQKKFNLKLDVEPGAEKIIIPRMLLQPLVENAIFHGIVPKNTDGEVFIKVYQTEEIVEFIVKDDGLGIDKEKLKGLNDPESSIASGEIGIGLRHIHDSLRLHYANQSEWSVTTEPDQGATIRIVLHKPHRNLGEGGV